MKFEDSKAQCVVGDANGVYIAQTFAILFEQKLREVKPKEDVDILIAGPDHPEYIEVYAELFPVTLQDDDGKKYVFAQVGESADIWEIPEEEYEQIEWDEV